MCNAGGVSNSIGLHELQHTWANKVIDNTGSDNHWGFSSANGVLGGFDLTTLRSHGGGRYTASPSNFFHNHAVPYSPIELYLAGYIPAEEVPDLWVGKNPAVKTAPPEIEGHDYVIEVSSVVELSIDDIVAQHGVRVPDSSAAQRDFRAAVIAIMDSPAPRDSYVSKTLVYLSERASVFSYAGNDDDSYAGNDDDNRYNFFEATGGRGSITMDGLSRLRKATPGVATLPSSFGERPPLHFCRSIQNGFAHHHPIKYGGRPSVFLQHGGGQTQHSRAGVEEVNDGERLGDIQGRLKAHPTATPPNVDVRRP